ncbi:uncharacterized protein LOC142652531 [Rhinoderma darwinii]|uniref:uncharacterized protein LOC142652531 n=1 Tax=Rhinoderma darwinii TaxID=43563 RepID=UPI003F67C51E
MYSNVQLEQDLAGSVPLQALLHLPYAQLPNNVKSSLLLKDTIGAWKAVRKLFGLPYGLSKFCPLWDNPMFPQGSQNKLFSQWRDEGINVLGQLMNVEEGRWLTWQEVSSKYNLRGNQYLQYAQVTELCKTKVCNIDVVEMRGAFDGMVPQGGTGRSLASLYGKLRNAHLDSFSTSCFRTWEVELEDPEISSKIRDGWERVRKVMVNEQWRRREGVFHYDRHMRYQLNYHNAQEACVQDFGGKIASRDQLEKALKSGLEECRAGWIISAEVAYPRINKHWNCGENKTGIISYGIRQNLQEKWDVFCYKEDDDCSRYDRAYFKVSWGTKESPTRNILPTTAPDSYDLSFTSEFPSTIPLNTLLSANAVPRKGDIYSNLLMERNQSDTKKINDSLDQDENNFDFSSGILSEQKEENISLNTTIVLNSTSDIYEDGQKSISLVTNITHTTHEPYLPTSDNRSHVGSSTIIPLNSSISRFEDVVNSISHENPYGIATRTEKFDVLPPLAVTTQNPFFYNKTFQLRSTFITGATTDIKGMNVSVTAWSQNETYSSDRLETKNYSYNTDFLSNSQHENATLENMFHLNSLQSQTEIVQTMTDKKSSQEQEYPRATTPLALSFPRMSPSDSPYKDVGKFYELFSKNKQDLYNGQKSENEMIVLSYIKNSSRFTQLHMPIENKTDVLHLTTDQITSQHGAFFDIHPTTSSQLQFQEKEVQVSVKSENNVLSEPTPVSNLQNETNIDGNRDITMGTLGNQKALDEVLTPKETSTSPTTVTLSAKVSEEIQSPKQSQDIAPTISSVFTPYDHMKVTASPTPQSNVTNLSLDSCGGWIKALSGQFHSPGFPQSYEKDMNCIWVIEVPLGLYVILDFVSLVIEEHRNCDYDYVLVYDGMESDQRVLGRFCGSQLPSQIRASSNVMTVIMRSDTSVELDGISVQFKTTQSSSGVFLTEGKNSLEGVVEIEYHGVRGNICAKQWTNNDAQVVCRQLGFSGPAIATRIRGDDSVSWAISLVSCNGGESALENCRVKSKGLCGTIERASVICQVYESCANLRNAGVQESGTYTIDPDGVGQGESHFTVECDMASDVTTGITIVGHDSEGKERVSPCQTPGCYSRVITYKSSSLAQLRSLTSISENCEQFVKLDCRHVRFLDGPWGWWVSRDGDQIISWGGSNTNSGRCACGENGN